MSFLGRIFAGDEELGKKNDDHRRGRGDKVYHSWSVRNYAPWLRRRRIIYGLIACITLYLFFKNIPPPDHPPFPRPQYRPKVHDRSPQHSAPIPATGKEKPPKPEKPSDAENQYYDGPIRFYKLAASLQAISNLRGQSAINKNVLFAAANLRSASELIPMACEMGKWNRNNVHFALMGRDDLDMEEIKVLNGVDEECNINWHDARPDFSPWSSDFRMEVSVSAGLGHIQNFMHPQAIIIDDSDREDVFFTKAIRGKALELGKAVVELPQDASENLMWITRLDSSSIAAWQTTYVDILIHAPPSSSGSLLRLLKSVEAADYFGCRRPHLTIELPADIDPPTWDYLENLVWPPIDWSGAPHASQVTLRHRIPHRPSNSEDASIRYVESFYPARPADSHVLVLSPQVELSPLYFHYLMYHLLEFKYSSLAPRSTEGRNLMGLSLELPYLHLNDSMVFTPPTVLREPDGSTSEPKEPTSFLWQAPNSNAALYFGDKWVEFHSFLASRVLLDPAKAPTPAKQVSDIYPSWLEYMLELMRARGYSLLYPGLIPSEDSIATIHYEIYQPPDEYSNPKLQSTSDEPIPPLDPNEPFKIDPSEHPTKPKSRPESTPLTTNLLSILHNSGIIQDTAKLPLLSYQGNSMTSEILEASAHSFARVFRREIGQCPTDRMLSHQAMSANDLFCNEGKAASDVPGEYRDPISPYSGMRNEITTEPEVQDDSGQRQDEFAAHLQRQKLREALADTGKEVREEAKGHLARQTKKGAEGQGEGEKEGKEDDKAKFVGMKADKKTATKSPDNEKKNNGKPATKKEEAKGKEDPPPPPIKDRGW